MTAKDKSTNDTSLKASAAGLPLEESLRQFLKAIAAGVPEEEALRQFISVKAPTVGLSLEESLRQYIEASEAIFSRDESLRQFFKAPAPSLPPEESLRQFIKAFAAGLPREEHLRQFIEAAFVVHLLLVEYAEYRSSNLEGFATDEPLVVSTWENMKSNLRGGLQCIYREVRRLNLPTDPTPLMRALYPHDDGSAYSKKWIAAQITLYCLLLDAQALQQPEAVKRDKPADTPSPAVGENSLSESCSLALAEAKILPLFTQFDDDAERLSKEKITENDLGMVSGYYMGYPMFRVWIGNRRAGTRYGAYHALNRVHILATRVLMEEAEREGLNSHALLDCARLVQELYADDPERYYAFDLTETGKWPECMGAARWTLPPAQLETLRVGEEVFIRLATKLKLKDSLPAVMQAVKRDKDAGKSGGRDEKPPDAKEIFQVKPNLYGIGFDLKELLRRFWKWMRGKFRKKRENCGKQ